MTSKWLLEYQFSKIVSQQPHNTYTPFLLSHQLAIYCLSRAEITTQYEDSHSGPVRGSSPSSLPPSLLPLPLFLLSIASLLQVHIRRLPPLSPSKVKNRSRIGIGIRKLARDQKLNIRRTEICSVDFGGYRVHVVPSANKHKPTKFVWHTVIFATLAIMTICPRHIHYYRYILKLLL